MYGMYVSFVCCFLYCNLLQLTLVEGLLLPFFYIHTCVIFNKCIQTLKKTPKKQKKQHNCNKAKCHLITDGAENKIKWKNVYINIYNQIFVINHVNKHICMLVAQ